MGRDNSEQAGEGIGYLGCDGQNKFLFEESSGNFCSNPLEEIDRSVGKIGKNPFSGFSGIHKAVNQHGRNIAREAFSLVADIVVIACLFSELGCSILGCGQCRIYCAEIVPLGLQASFALDSKFPGAAFCCIRDDGGFFFKLGDIEIAVGNPLFP